MPGVVAAVEILLMLEELVGQVVAATVEVLPLVLHLEQAILVEVAVVVVDQ
jgi:hypothetical protein